MMRVVLLFLLVALNCWAGPGQSLEITADTGSYTIPDEAPFNNIGARRMECRMDISSLDCSSSADLWQFGSNFALACNSGDATYLRARYNSQLARVDKTGRSDILVRAQYDPNDQLHGGLEKFWIEIWDIDGTNYARDSGNGSVGNDDTSGSNSIGGGKTFDIAWCRIYDTLTPLGSGPIRQTDGLTPFRSNRGIPNNVVSDSPLGEWNFEGDLTDDGPDAMNVSITGTAFGSSPSISPIANIEVSNQPLYYEDRVCRAGQTCTLDSARSVTGHDSDATLTYSWSFQSYDGPFSGAAYLEFSSTTVAAPDIQCSVFGEYVVRLQVTDQNSNTDTVDQEIGCVATDENGVVALPQAGSVYANDLRLILADPMRFGISPWPAVDKLGYDMANAYGWRLTAAATDKFAGDHWNTTLTGTIQLTNGSDTITGTGTSFIDEVCAGDNDAHFNTRITVIPTVGATANTRVDLNPVNSGGCVSDTEITLESNYSGTNEPGEISFSVWGGNDLDMCLGCWSGDSDNNNYYDLVLAFYNFYYTTGLAKYRDYARDLASRWWTNPQEIDEGRAQGAGAKNRAPLGTWIFFSEQGGTDGNFLINMDDGLELDCDLFVWDTDFFNNDKRIAGYRLVGKTACAMLHPDSGRRSDWTTDITDSFSTGDWSTLQETSGYVGSFLHTFSHDDGSGDLVDVQNNSTEVTYTAGSCGSKCNNGDVWGARASGGVENITTSYLIDSYSFPTMTLQTAWQGTTETGWIPATGTLSENPGRGSSPWQIQPGIGMWMADFAGIQETSTDFLSYMQFLADYAISAGNRGAYNQRVYPLCEDGDGGLESDAPDPPTPYCGGNDTESAKENARLRAFEMLKVFGLGLREARGVDQTLYDQIKTLADDVVAAQFAGYENWGGPGVNDGIHITEMAEVSRIGASGGGKPKDFGFAFGFSSPYVYLAERIGGLASEDLVDYSIAFTLPGDATQVTVTLYEPKGSTSVVEVCTVSPCLVEGDRRQGDHYATLEYNDTGAPANDEEGFFSAPAEAGASGAGAGGGAIGGGSIN